MKVHKQKHNPAVVTAFFASYKIPAPVFEYQFHPVRKWRFDMCWFFDKEMSFPPVDTVNRVAVYLEVQGGIWLGGGHNRGAQMKSDWEKYNTATELGWRPLFCEPKDLLKRETSEMIRRALCLG